MRTTALALVYALALAFGLYQAFGPTIDSRFARVQTERGDGMLNHYILEHSWQSLSNPVYRGSLVSPPFFYPEPYALWYSEHMLGVAPLYWVLRLGSDSVLAYQLWQIILDALNFLAFAYIMRRLGSSHLLALLGGYLWAFALVHIDQIKHQQMIPRFWMPLAAYYAWSFVLAPSSRAFNRMTAFTFLQSISCVYTGWFLAVGLVVFLPLAVLLRRGGLRDVWQLVRAKWLLLLLLLIGWALAFAVAFVPYIVVNADISRTYEDCDDLIPTPAAWVTGPPGTPWDQTLGARATDRDLPPPGPRAWVSDECWLFCGFGLYALVAAAAAFLGAQCLRVTLRYSTLWPPEMALAAAGLATALIWMTLTLTLENKGESLWEVVRFVPGATAIRCVSRVYVTIHLFGILSSLVWLDQVANCARPIVRGVLLTLIAVGLIYEQTGYTPPSFARADFYDAVERVAAPVRGAEVLYLRPSFTDSTGHRSGGVYGEVFAMWVGLRANVPVVNGYSGRFPPGDYPSGPNLPDAALTHWLKQRVRGQLTIVVPDEPDRTRVIAVE